MGDGLVVDLEHCGGGEGADELDGGSRVEVGCDGDSGAGDGGCTDEVGPVDDESASGGEVDGPVVVGAVSVLDMLAESLL